jgi:hypothetical protein
VAYIDDTLKVVPLSDAYSRDCFHQILSPDVGTIAKQAQWNSLIFPRDL